MSVPDHLRPVARAQRCTTRLCLNDCLRQAEDRVLDARRIPWPALEQSWQREVDQIQALIADRGASCSSARASE